MAVNKMIYGIDIGGTKIEITVFDENMQQKDNWRINTPTDCYQEFISAISDMIFEADGKFKLKGKVGIGMPGLSDQNGLSLSANISIANGQNVAKDLGKKEYKKEDVIKYYQNLYKYNNTKYDGGQSAEYSNNILYILIIILLIIITYFIFKKYKL